MKRVLLFVEPWKSGFKDSYIKNGCNIHTNMDSVIHIWFSWQPLLMVYYIPSHFYRLYHMSRLRFQSMQALDHCCGWTPFSKILVTYLLTLPTSKRVCYCVLIRDLLNAAVDLSEMKNKKMYLKFDILCIK